MTNRDGARAEPGERRIEDASALVPHGPPWRADAPSRLHDNPWFGLESYAATAPTEVPATYYMLRFANVATGVVPLHDDGAVTLVGQWRFPLGAYSWELPEGGAPHVERPEDGARRELAEEAGLKARDLVQIVKMHLSNAASDEVAYVYLATGLSEVDAAPEPTEALALVRIPFMQALAAALDGRITDSMTVAGLLRVHHMAVTGALAPDLARRVLGQAD